MRATRGMTLFLLAMLAIGGCGGDETSPPADTTAPSTPAGLTATAYSATQINLTWTAATDNVGVAGYQVKRGGTTVGNPTATSFSDTGLTPDTGYCYEVLARDAAGNTSAASSQACDSTFVLDLTPPSVPQNVFATSLGSTSISLTWSPSTDKAESVARYDVYRNNSLIGNTTTTTYTDQGLTAQTSYCYTVKAVDRDGNQSAASTESCTATTPGEREYSATGSYVYDSVHGTLTLNITASGFPCNGPEVGTQTITVVSLTATELIIEVEANQQMIFTRTTGVAGNIAGNWSGTDPGGTEYEFLFNANGQFTIIGHMTRSCIADAWMAHWQDGYYVDVILHDPNHSFTSVTVTGPGITGGLSLCYANGEWTHWNQPCNTQIHLIGTPTPPLNYVFTYADGTGVHSDTATISCVLEDLPTGLAPSGIVSGPIVFSWTRVAGTGYRYQIQLNNNNGNRIWESEWGVLDISSTPYTGPTLPAGHYTYYLNVEKPNEGCGAMGQGSFDYTGR
jgi:chitodextrinase